MNTRACPNCSQPTAPGAANCAFCGKALSEISDAPQSFTGSAARDFWLGALIVALIAVALAVIPMILLASHATPPASGVWAFVKMGPALKMFYWSSAKVLELAPATLVSGILWWVLHHTLGGRRPHLVRGVRSGFLVLVVVELGAFAACTATLFAGALSNR